MHNAQFFLRYKLHHFFAWMLLLGLWYFLRVDDYPLPSTAFVVTTIKVVDLAAMIYLTNYLLIPRLLYRKKFAWFTLAFIAMILASSMLKMNVLGRYLRDPSLYNWSADIRKSIYDNVIPHFFLVIAGAAGKLILDYGSLQQRMIETAKEKAEAELNFLKSQINPHFVFNSLNSVYFLINKDNVEAREALFKFSEMLRYQLYEMNDDTVPIEKEVRYLEDYMVLQQLRKDEKYKVDLNCDRSVKGFSIAPLLLIPLVENAFKHLSHHTDAINTVNVKMRREHNLFIFSVVNSTEAIASTEGQGGIGLQNVKRRLALLYPGKHDLDIEKCDGKFSATLKISIA
jgi:two-component system LytT family sensor kinase